MEFPVRIVIAGDQADGEYRVMIQNFIRDLLQELEGTGLLHPDYYPWTTRRLPAFLNELPLLASELRIVGYAERNRQDQERYSDETHRASSPNGGYYGG